VRTPWSKRKADRIAAAFARCRKERRAAFIPFIMAGDPSLERLPELVRALARGGADVIELGVPFSDPIADGPVNQRAATRAINGGATMSGILQQVAAIRSETDVPIVLFTYFNLIHRRGVERFAEQASGSGIDGVLCVDLPPDEAEEETAPIFVRHGIDPIFLLAPTSSEERTKSVVRASRGFVYYASRTAVTGEQTRLPAELLGELRKLRRRVKQPIAVGFGISTPEQAAAVAAVADGVIVGSHLVRLIEEHGADRDLAARLEVRVRELASATRPGALEAMEAW
jgi:tryptophan synthase alpha chain